jgi:RNA polymerase sigma factor FliA
MVCASSCAKRVSKPAAVTLPIGRLPGMDRGTRERERLILEHIPQVRLHALRAHGKMPARVRGSVLLDDLISAGTIGLIWAVDHYDPCRGVQLNTFADLRIRGAIADSLRKLDWGSRSRRIAKHRISSARKAVEQKLGAEAPDDLIAQGLGVSLKRYHELVTYTHGIDLESLERGPEARGSLADVVSAPEGCESPAGIDRAMLVARLRAAVARLPAKERNLLRLLIDEEMTLTDAAKAMCLSVPGVHHIKQRALLHLRADFASPRNAAVQN